MVVEVTVHPRAPESQNRQSGWPPAPTLPPNFRHPGYRPAIAV
jgi:hypothetical protein